MGREARDRDGGHKPEKQEGSPRMPRIGRINTDGEKCSVLSTGTCKTQLHL